MGCLLLTMAAALGAPPPQSFGADEYYRMIVEQRGRIKSMQGTYEAETVPDKLAEKSGAMRGQTRRTRITFAWAGEKRLRKEEIEWVDPSLKINKNQSVNVYNGKQFRRREIQLLQVQETKSAYAEMNAYLSGLKWPITEAELEEVRLRREESHFLPHFLKAKNWRVRPKMESVDGTPCVVLEQTGGGRRLWLDPGRGYCMLRLEHDRPSPEYTMWVNQYRNFKEVVPGVFLPLEIVGANIHAPSSKMPQGTLTTTLRVIDLRVNDVPDHAFVLEPSPGDFVSDLTTNQMYKYAPADDRTLEVSAEQALANVGYGERRAVWWGLFYFFCAMVAGVCIGAAATRLVSWRRNRLGAKTDREREPATDEEPSAG